MFTAFVSLSDSQQEANVIICHSAVFKYTRQTFTALTVSSSILVFQPTSRLKLSLGLYIAVAPPHGYIY